MLRFVTRLLLPCLALLAGSGPPTWAGQTPLPWVARHGLSAAELERQPLAGSVFVHDPGVRGRDPNAWAG